MIKMSDVVEYGYGRHMVVGIGSMDLEDGTCVKLVKLRRISDFWRERTYLVFGEEVERLKIVDNDPT